MKVVLLIITLLGCIIPEMLLAGPYTADIEPAGAPVPYDEFFFPYLLSLVAAAILTLYLGLKGLLNIPRRLIRAYYSRVSKALDMRDYSFWIIDKIRTLLLLGLILLPIFAYVMMLNALGKIDSMAISGALEGFLLAFAFIVVISDEALEDLEKYTSREFWGHNT